MGIEFDASLFVRRLAHYAFTYMPGPKGSDRERANRAKQAHLDGRLAIQLAHVLDANPDLLGDDWVKEALSSESD